MPKNLFFDLDHTIWDFEGNANETLKELYEMYNIAQYSNNTVNDFLSTYHKVNDKYWALYRQHKVKKEVLRSIRFTETFELMGMPLNAVPENIWKVYLDICPTKTRLMPGAIETLDYLNGKYNLHLITNGFAETQKRKLKHSGLEKFFDTLTISEEVGVQKPHPVIFKKALENAKSTLKTGQYVGDNPIADVLGGLNSDWKVYWYNPENKDLETELLANSNLKILSHLKELVELF